MRITVGDPDAYMPTCSSCGRLAFSRNKAAPCWASAKKLPSAVDLGRKALPPLCEEDGCLEFIDTLRQVRAIAA